MRDKSWMLNPSAIRRAKVCIDLAKKLTGERLKLSDPNFFPRLSEIVKKAKSTELSAAHDNLMSMASFGDVVKQVSAAQ